MVTIFGIYLHVGWNFNKRHTPMKHILTFLIFFGLGQQVYCQTTDTIILKNLIGIWGQVSEYAPEHRGKSGLILLTLNRDKTFYAYENTDYGATILQSGIWDIKKTQNNFYSNYNQAWQKWR